MLVLVKVLKLKSVDLGDVVEVQAEVAVREESGVHGETGVNVPATVWMLSGKDPGHVMEIEESVGVVPGISRLVVRLCVPLTGQPWMGPWSLSSLEARERMSCF